MNRCARNLRFWWLAPFGFIVVPLRPEPFCVRVPWSAATTPYWSVSWLPDGSLVAGTNQLVEFADDERRAEPAPGLSALRVLLPVSGTRLLAAGVGDATLFDRSTGVWRHDTGRALQKPASGIIDARISDDGASVVLAAIGSVQYVHGNRASEWAVPTLSRICLGRVSGRLAVCHPPYAVLGMTPRGPVERPDLAWADGAAMLLSAGGRIVGIFQGRIGVFHPDGTFLWEPSEAEKMLAEWVIDAGGDDRVLWIATNKGGIRWYDPATGGKIAEAHVSRELSGRICAVNQHPDGRLAVATESCLYVVYPPSVSSAPLPPGHFLFLRSCNGGAVAATSEGHISIGSEVPPLGDAALAFAEWQGREVIGAIGAVSVGGIPCRIDGRAVVDLIPAGDRLLILQAGRAVLINRDLTVSAQTALPEVPNGAADTGGGFLIGTLSGALLRWRPPEPLTVVRSSDPLPHPVRIKSVRGAVWRLAGRSAFRDDDRVPLPEGTFPVDVSGDSAGAWLLCSDAAEGANLWSVPDKGPPILMDAPGIAALRQPQGLLVMPSGRFAIADSSRVLLVDRAVVRPIAAALPGPAAAFAIGPPGERALSLAGPVLGLSAAEDSLVLRWSGGDPLSARQIRWRILPDGAWQQGGPLSVKASRLPRGSGAIAVNLWSRGRARTDVFPYVRQHPWFLRPWSFGLFAALLLGFASSAVGLGTRRLARRARRLEELVAERTQALARSNAAKEEFFASMSHEIRNPINGVLGICSMLDEAPLPPREQLLARTLRGCSEQLRSLLDDTLDFSRIERGCLTLHPEDFALQPAIEAAARTVDVGLDRVELRLPSELLWFSGDHLKLRQIVINLVMNALKYGAPSRAAVTCAVARAGGHPGSPLLTVSVRNTGPTIPPGEIPLLFEAFHRGSAAGSSGQSGRGSWPGGEPADRAGDAGRSDRAQ